MISKDEEQQFDWKTHLTATGRYIGIVFLAVLFGVTLASLEPYPNEHFDEICTDTGSFYLGVMFLLRRTRFAKLWTSFGLVTVYMWFLVTIWFYHGSMHYGWWYPPHPEIVQLFVSVDGESTCDAQVTNVFLVVWPGVTSFMVIRFLAKLTNLSDNG